MKMSLSIDSHARRMTGNKPIKQFDWTSDYLLSSTVNTGIKN